MRPQPLDRARHDAATAALACARSPFPVSERDADELRAICRRERLGHEVERLVERAARAARGELAPFGRSLAFAELELDPLSGRPVGEGGDPRGAWEAARMGHLVELGAASLLAPGRADAWRRAFAEQVADLARWFPAPASGLHWTSPLEISLRGLHVCAGFHLLGGAARFPSVVARLVAGVLHEHGAAVAARVEDGGVVRGTHLLGNWVALAWLGAAIGRTDWLRRAEVGLRVALQEQIGADGGDFEASTSYHRFALELAVAALLLERAGQAQLGAAFERRVARMFAFVRGTMTPDGRDPGIGDSDDSRVLPMVPRVPGSQAHLLPIGAALLGDPALRPAGSRLVPEALLLGGADGYERFRSLREAPPPPSEAFPQFGLYVLRRRGDYVSFRCGSVGQRGVGGHAHNDQLSIVAHLGGRAIVEDPGTGAYSLDPLWRDRFRGTAAHATVIVDGREQSPLPVRPFALFDRARAQCLGWAPDEVVGEHHGYERLREPVTHRRRCTCDRAARAFVITDELIGSGAHDLELSFPLAQPARCGLGARTARRLRAIAGRAGFASELTVEIGPAGGPYAALAPLGRPNLALALVPALRSPRYGHVEAATRVCYTIRAALPIVLRLALVALEEDR
jgi:hypothetical protein